MFLGTGGDNLFSYFWPNDSPIQSTVSYIRSQVSHQSAFMSLFLVSSLVHFHILVSSLVHIFHSSQFPHMSNLVTKVLMSSLVHSHFSVPCPIISSLASFNSLFSSTLSYPNSYYPLICCHNAFPLLHQFLVSSLAYLYFFSMVSSSCLISLYHHQSPCILVPIILQPSYRLQYLCQSTHFGKLRTLSSPRLYPRA